MARSVEAIQAHIRQVNRSLHDSQEHRQIVRLEYRLQELVEELRLAQSITPPTQTGEK